MPSETTRPQTETHTITVREQRLRVAIRSGNGTRTPLLLMNGIRVNFEALQPFVDALDPCCGYFVHPFGKTACGKRHDRRQTGSKG